MSVTKESLQSLLGREVQELHVAIAKHELQGVGLSALAEIFACDEQEIQHETATTEYVEVKRAVAMMLAQFSADTDISWDSLEHKSLQKLGQIVSLTNDPEFHLKVAAIANKAQRRHRQTLDVLNPAAVGTRVNLTLSERFVRKLTSGESIVQERRIDITRAAEHRVSAKEVQGFLNPSLETSAMARLDQELEKVA